MTVAIRQRFFPVAEESPIHALCRWAGRLTAYQYCAERPGSDLAEVLSGRKDFAAAPGNAVVPFVAAVAEAPARQ